MFLNHLESVVSQVEGALACSVMGFDGIAVETHPAAPPPESDVDINNTWVEFAHILSQVKHAAGLLKTGDVSEISINTERIVTLMRCISSEYFLVLAIKPLGNYGKARYALRIAAPRILAEL